MNRLFNPDNIVMQFLSMIYDLVVLNVLFIISCIPIITIGASTSALYYVSLKMLRGEAPYIGRNFWKSFRENFKQATLIWLMFLAAGGLLVGDFLIIHSLNTGIFAVVRVVLWIICAILVSMFLYVFPFISHFKCTTKQALKNSFLLAIGQLPYTLLLIVLHGAIPFIATRSVKLFSVFGMVEMICGFSVIAFTACIFFDRIFKKFEPEEVVTPSNWE